MDVTESPRIEELRRRVQKDPTSIAFAQLAEECRRVGDYQEAVNVCRSGLACHPTYLSARVTLGRALMELDELNDAQAELEAVLGLAPDNLAAIRALAEIHQRRGEGGETFHKNTTAPLPAGGSEDPPLRTAEPDLPASVEATLEPPPASAPEPSESPEPSDPVVDELRQWLAAIVGDRSNQR
jgi:tetratricopeptide (TPR) repeat protein